MEREITENNMVDTLMDFVNKGCGEREALVDLYNHVYETEYTIDDVEWNSEKNETR